VNMVPVVRPRPTQTSTPVLYVSTTIRFCRAVKQCCVKGNGELVSCWKDTLKDLERETSITGPDMYHEIHNPTLTAFIRRVDPNSWHNYIPKHVESMIEDPIMVKAVELAIRLMAGKIPNAFPVAELMYFPIKNVKAYLEVWKAYAADSAVQRTLRRNRIAMVEGQLKTEWDALVLIAQEYARKAHVPPGPASKACADIVDHRDNNDIAKAQKVWYALVNHTNTKSKEVVQMAATAKVLLLKLRTYYNKLKKGLKVGVSEAAHPRLPPRTQRTNGTKTDTGPGCAETRLPTRSPITRVCILQ
ncbi:MAG: hypothetical protein ACRC41_17230, partial [Sarcina sp.]